MASAARVALVAVALCAVLGVVAAANIEDVFRAARFDGAREGESFRKWFKPDGDDDDDDDLPSVFGGHLVRRMNVRAYNTFNVTEAAMPGVFTTSATFGGYDYGDGFSSSFKPFSGGFYVEHRHIDDDDDDDDDTSATSSDLEHHTHTVYGVSYDEDYFEGFNYISYLEADTERYFNLRAVAVLVGRSGTPLLTYDYANTNELGIDPAGLVRAGDGHFWVADRAYPSLLKVNVEHGRATVLKKFIPAGRSTDAREHDTEVVEAFPAAFSGVFQNSFAGIAISRDRSKLFLLCNRPSTSSQPLGAVRLFVFSTEHERVIAQYVVVLDPVASFAQPDAPGGGTPAGISAGSRRFEGLSYIDDEHLLALEAVDVGGYNNANGYTRVCTLKLKHATNIGDEFDSIAAAPALDGNSVAELPPLVVPVEKEKVLDVPFTGDDYEPVDLQIVADRYIAIAYDAGDWDRYYNNYVEVYKLDHELA